MKRALNLRQIDAFRAVMLTGSAVQAGSLLGVTQPAVSRLLKDLEGQIGLALFERSHGRLNPTADAEALYEEVERAYGALDRIAQAIDGLRRLKSGHLRLVATSPLAHGLAPMTVARFRASCPDVTVTVKATVRREMRGWLDAQEFDIALVTMPVDYPAEMSERLCSLPSVCVLPPGHRLAARIVIEARDLTEEPFVSVLPEAVARFRIDLAFERAGVRRNLAIEAQTARAACEIVATGVGVSVVDPVSVRGLDGQVKIRPFRPEIPYEFGLLFPLRRSPIRAATMFAETVRSCVRELFPRKGKRPIINRNMNKR